MAKTGKGTWSLEEFSQEEEQSKRESNACAHPLPTLIIRWILGGPREWECEERSEMLQRRISPHPEGNVRDMNKRILPALKFPNPFSQKNQITERFSHLLSASWGLRTTLNISSSWELAPTFQKVKNKIKFLKDGKSFTHGTEVNRITKTVIFLLFK